MNNVYYWPEFIAEINKELKEGQTILDAGAGDRHWKDHLQKRVKYISMDLGVGDDALDYSKLDIKGDLRNIPLEDSSVDVIICIQVLEHVPEPWIVLKEFNRVLKPGGQLFFSCPQGEPMHQVPYDFFRYTKYGLEWLLNLSGFKIDFIKPQKGTFYKIASDLRKVALLLESGGLKVRATILKATAKSIDLLFGKLDSQYSENTIGYFVHAYKI